MNGYLYVNILFQLNKVDEWSIICSVEIISSVAFKYSVFFVFFLFLELCWRYHETGLFKRNVFKCINITSTNLEIIKVTRFEFDTMISTLHRQATTLTFKCQCSSFGVIFTSSCMTLLGNLREAGKVNVI